VTDVIGDLRSSLTDIERTREGDELAHIGAAGSELLNQIARGIDPGTPTGIDHLNDAIQGGMKAGQLIVVAGATGMGKTSFATQIAYAAAHWAALKPEKRGAVLIFSFEMNPMELIMKLVFQVELIRDGFKPSVRRPKGFTDRDLPAVERGIADVSKLPIRVEDKVDRNVEAVRGAVERWVGVNGRPSLVIVDHIGLMHSAGRKTGNRTEEVSMITRGLKEMAMQLDVPVMALAQLSRQVDQREDKRPMLSDLRESGCLSGETKVYLPDEGVYRTMAELVGTTGFRVMAIDTKTWKLEPREVTSAFSTGVKSVFRLTTRSGQTVRATGNHKFLAFDGWRRLEELAVGSHIALPRELAALATSDVVWDEVASIIPDGIEEVFDLTVDGLHSFVANDIIVHNSIEQDANIVIFVYRESYYQKDKEIKKEYETAAEAHIIVAKNRAGTQEDIKMVWIGPNTLFGPDMEYYRRNADIARDSEPLFKAAAERLAIQEGSDGGLSAAASIAAGDYDVPTYEQTLADLAAIEAADLPPADDVFGL
jgi:replicative DNA helicase